MAKQQKYFTPVYTDILATGSLKEFSECFGKSVLTALAKNEPAIRKILKSLTSIRPKISIDPLSGEPSVGFTVSNDQ
ncbi:MAG TPA: hypothetical protein PKL65_01930 [Bacteroidales bacterium]|jgi:hypothetical protein|nr:hypothetical protein [Bacteroidales bacterium]HNR40965.1 hypothetical protein [Bacteroidales bacterium]